MVVESSSRRTIRLPGYDYTSDSTYYVTICTQGRANLLGKIVKDRAFLSPFGRLVDTYLATIDSHYQGINVSEYIIMPNHVHAVIHVGRTRGSAPTLGSIIKKFKSYTTNQYITGISQYNWKSFDKRLWQRNYFEHIVRNQGDLERIYRYIRNNPANWTKDRMYT